MDTITYTKNEDGTITKSVVGKVANVAEEAAAIQAQLTDLLAGTVDGPEEQAAIAALVANYQEALTILQ